MSPLNFCYFLQGFFEINNDGDQQLSAHQVQIIKDHLALVFNKVTPDYFLSTKLKYEYTNDLIKPTTEQYLYYPTPPHSC